MIKDLTNKKFGRLTAISPTRMRSRNGCVIWECMCSCGNKPLVSGSDLSSGNIASCGCSYKIWQKSGNARRTHGQRKKPIYWVWTTMKSRCLNPKNKKYNRYGGRGIKICKRWLKFENFYKDMENRYKKGLQIDRINNNRGYYKSNCRWTTCKINNNNRYY